MNTPTIQAPQPDLDGPAPRRRIAVMFTLAAVLVLLVSWVYALFFYDPGLLIDELPDRTFPEAAEQVCARAQTEFDALPFASESHSADERAETVAASNVIFAQMIDDLRPLVSDAQTLYLEDAEKRFTKKESQGYAKGIGEWVDDWGTYLGDRQQYVENLANDDDARFLETTKGSDTKGITRAINSFAQVNAMTSCVTPGDVS